MQKTLVIGASGKIGKLVVSQLVKLNHSVIALVRDKHNCSFPEPVEVIEGDLEADIKFAMTGCHSVIFSAGSGANTGLDKTLLVDLWGRVKRLTQRKKLACNILLW